VRIGRTLAPQDKVRFALALVAAGIPALRAARESVIGEGTLRRAFRSYPVPAPPGSKHRPSPMAGRPACWERGPCARQRGSGSHARADLAGTLLAAGGKARRNGPVAAGRDGAGLHHHRGGDRVI